MTSSTEVSTNIHFLIDNKLTFDQYSICFLLHTKNQEMLQAYLIVKSSIFSQAVYDDLQYLESQEFIIFEKVNGEKNYEDLSSIRITEKFTKLIHSDTDLMFQQLLDTYPKQTPSGRRLQAGKHIIKKKYINLIKQNPSLHETIIKCIKIELVNRQQSLFELNSMPLLSTYLHQKRWDTYEEDLNADINVNSGEDVI